jgi:hypothetical protein
MRVIGLAVVLAVGLALVPSTWSRWREAMAGYLAPFSLFLGLMLAAVPSAAFESKYQGRPLRVSSDTGPLTWTCMAEYAASTGYYRGTGWTLAADYKKQSRPATWIITVQPEGARVTDGQGNVGRYMVTKTDGSGIILVEAEAGTSIQVITIDPSSSSSFVYTTQNAQAFWNRATTFTGTCQ